MPLTLAPQRAYNGRTSLKEIGWCQRECQHGGPEKKRLPQLSSKPDSKGKYYAGYRDRKGKCQKERLSRDLAESQVLYARWISANFDDDGYLLAQPVYQDSPATERHAAILTSWPYIVDGYLDYQTARRRPAEAKRARGMIAPEGYEEAKYLLKLISKWMAERFKDFRATLDQLRKIGT